MLAVTTNIKHQEIYRTSQLVSKLYNAPIRANKAIVGSNAFSHSSSIHQDDSARLRITLMANHQLADIAQLMETLNEFFNNYADE